MRVYRQLRKALRTLARASWGGTKGYHKTEADHARRRVDKWSFEDGLEQWEEERR